MFWHGEAQRGKAGSDVRKEKVLVYERKKYAWRVNHGVPAEVAGRVMEEIEKEHGEVTKELFLEASRPEDSPTHKCFEWDDSVAAEKYRLGQSYHCILDLEIKYEEVDEEKRTPAFVNIIKKTSEESARYRSVEVAMSDDDMRRQVLANALSELKAIEAKYNHLIELSSVFAAIDTAERRLSA